MNNTYEQEVVAILKNNNIPITHNRVIVFQLLKANKRVQSISSIIKLSATPLDRISVYRTLQCFVKKGIALIVPNNDRSADYILVEKMDTALDSNQSYFVCTCCHHKELVHVPFNLTENNFTQYQVIKFNLLLEGLCTNCK